jgi:solute carrier family 40 (iron-regulated transporter), member 1
MVQELGQVEIPASQRSSFAGVEQSFKSLGELAHWLATVVWSQPEDFRWLAFGSLVVTGLSAGMFGTWVRNGKTSLARSGGEYEGIPLTDNNDEDHEDIPYLNRP